MSENTTTSTSTAENDKPRRPIALWKLLAAMLLAALVTFGITALLMNIFERKQEAKNPYLRVVEVDDNTTDPAKWGVNWPRHFDGYSRTVDETHTRYGGSDGAPTAPGGPVVAKSRLDTEPWLKRMFAGYAFAIDFRERRGHAYMLSDQRETLRVLNKPQAGACLNCHSSIVLICSNPAITAGQSNPCASASVLPCFSRPTRR